MSSQDRPWRRWSQQATCTVSHMNGADPDWVASSVVSERDRDPRWATGSWRAVSVRLGLQQDPQPGILGFSLFGAFPDLLQDRQRRPVPVVYPFEIHAVELCLLLRPVIAQLGHVSGHPVWKASVCHDPGRSSPPPSQGAVYTRLSVSPMSCATDRKVQTNTLSSSGCI